jgi:hypothetical protein
MGPRTVKSCNPILYLLAGDKEKPEDVMMEADNAAPVCVKNFLRFMVDIDQIRPAR